MEREELTQKIKERARALGFDPVGIAPASALADDRFSTWLARGYHGQMAYLERNAQKRLDPKKVLEGTRSILSVVLNYFHPYELPYKESRLGVISRYASGDDYHQVIEKKLKELLGFIREVEPGVEGKIYVDTGPVLDKYWAARSSVGWLGKHTNVLARGHGSWFFIGEILLDVDLEYDSAGKDYCGSCTRCIEACPTGAITEPYVLDSRRCISYLTIELRDDIPEQLREPMGNFIYGCDVCQDVCPWNRQLSGSLVEQFKPRETNRAPELRELARISPQDFRERYHRSPIKRTKWQGLMRNIAVALGNSRNPESVVELTGLLNTDDSMVRRHAAWALARIGTSEAVAVIRERWEKERDQETFRTLESLLQDLDAL